MPRKDIFIDNNIAKNFSNPLDPEYKRLIRWLMEFSADNKENCAHLAVSKKLIGEYLRTSKAASSPTSIPIIIDKLTREGRLNMISNSAIKQFKQVYFTNRVLRRLRSNSEDREFIPVVLLSDRKYALTIDDKFIYDLVHFSGFTVLAKKRPQDIPYAE